MPRPILSPVGSKINRLSLLESANVGSEGILRGPALEKRLRERRSPRYVELMTRLDAGGHAFDRQRLEALLAAISEELPEVTIEQFPIGIVSECYLGAPYEVHCLDRSGNILEHYKVFESLPPALQPARSLALHGAYSFIEVYPDGLRGVGTDGVVSFLRN